MLFCGRVTHSLACYAVQIVGLLARPVASHVLALRAHQLAEPSVLA